MVRPSAHLAALETARPRDWLIRFAFGGLVSVATGLIGHFWGAEIGGLFLAFPAILPATLTLAESRDGREEAAADARGGTLGALGLIAFACASAVLLANTFPAVALTGALVVWLLTSVGLWWTLCT